MVNMKDKITKTFPTELNGKQLIRFPRNIAINKDERVIYVSDYGTLTVTCPSIEGQVKAYYKHGNTWSPRGVAVSNDGVVYVCDYHNDVIHILTADLKVMGVIDGKRFGIRNPDGLAYCQRERKLYVGLQNSKELVVLKF